MKKAHITIAAANEEQFKSALAEALGALQINPNWMDGFIEAFLEWQERKLQPFYTNPFNVPQAEPFYEGWIAGNRNGMRQVFEGHVNITIVKTYED